MDNNKICVIIPTYNEEKIIASVLKKTRALNLDVMLVDDGSTDSTVEIAGKNAAIILKNKQNRGKGAALKKGFDYALKRDYQFIVTMDGDGQHDPASIKEFIARQRKTNADIVIGNRMRNTENMPLIRIVTNRFMSWIISLASKQHIPDTQCGFRLIKRKILENITLLSSRYDMESEIVIKSAKKSYKIESVPIEAIYRGERSKIHPVLDTLRFIKTYLRLLF